eukprot:Hpha_TRINITY_DN8888_c0_g1::TRINITY_DN8888_c0_g1_i2::g.141642::m.141642
MSELRHLYARENITEAPIDYGRLWPFSMNSGDYAEPEYNPAEEFRVYDVSEVGGESGPFEELLRGVRFDSVCKGRRGTVLLGPHPTRGVPVVRTTTQYETPAQIFAPVHVRLIDRIRAVAGLRPHELNNALVETYTNEYAKMGAHSDQAQDLEEGSHIAVFSCYRHPERAVVPPRKLVVECKFGRGTFEVPMAHNSVVVWSTDTNRRFRHKIVLADGGRRHDNEWLGFTLRTSKAFVRCLEGGGAVFEDGAPLRVLSGRDAGEFYKMRARENRETDFVYPPLTYTLSPSDLLPPVPVAQEPPPESPRLG